MCLKVNANVYIIKVCVKVEDFKPIHFDLHCPISRLLRIFEPPSLSQIMRH